MKIYPFIIILHTSTSAKLYWLGVDGGKVAMVMARVNNSGPKASTHVAPLAMPRLHETGAIAPALLVRIFRDYWD